MRTPSSGCASGLLTWVAPEDGADALRRRMSRLQQLAEGWGETVFTPLVGDPLESLAASVPGFCCGATAEPALAPLTEALRLLPAGRPAPLSNTAAGHLFRSPDGKPLPFAWEDGEDYGFELIYGVPGRGKSVLMNSLGLAFCLQDGQARLPLSATIDIGPSSAGLISLIREALPPGRRHEAGWFALRMTRDHAINPCDTQLGCRSPLPAERAFLVNLLGLMMTPAGAEGVPDGMRELIGPAIAAVYTLRSDKIAGAEPHAYTQGRDAAVDAAVADAGIVPPEAPLWWEIVDLLFAAGAHDAAARAQLYAVPVLGDLLGAVREPAVQGLVGDTAHGTGGETVTQAFIRILTALSGDWPIMFAPTAFDIGHVRVAAVDLAEVAPQGSPEAARQTAAFYLLARHALTRHWWIGEDTLADIPEPYRAWHAARLRDIREAPKRLAFDEFHRTAGAPAVRAQVERDVREARKLRVRIEARGTLSLRASRTSRSMNSHRRRARRARPGRTRCARGAQAQGAYRARLAAPGGFRRRADRTCQPLLDPRRRRQGARDRGAVRDIRAERHPQGRHSLPPAGTRQGRRAGPADRQRCARALRAIGRQYAGSGRAVGADHQPR